MVPGFKEFADEGAEKQWRCVWLWSLPGSLSQTVYQGFDDACCVLSSSSEVEVGLNSLTLPCAFIPPVCVFCAVLLWMLFGLWSTDESTSRVMSEQHGAKWNSHRLWSGFHAFINVTQSAFAFWGQPSPPVVELNFCFH